MRHQKWDEDGNLTRVKSFASRPRCCAATHDPEFPTDEESLRKNQPTQEPHSRGESGESGHASGDPHTTHHPRRSARHRP